MIPRRLRFALTVCYAAACAELSPESDGGRLDSGSERDSGSGGNSGGGGGSAGSGGTGGSGGQGGSGGAGGFGGSGGQGGAGGNGGSGGSGGSGGQGGAGGAGGGGGGSPCVKKTCAQVGADCGLASDGCGGTQTCPMCSEGWVCGADALNKCGWYKMRVDPQYLALNKASTSTNTCCRWHYDDPSSINGNAVDEIRNTLYLNGANAKQDATNPHRRLAITFGLTYFEATDAQEDQILNNLFALAKAKNMPVVFKLDGVSWWENRGDLWNWFDPGQPGYNPANANNVEWTGWTSASAIKLSWRDWGSRIRIKPHPNFASPVYVAEKTASLRRLTRAIARWVKSLPINERYLFGGIILDNELSIGVNHFYYVNGNSYLGTGDPSTNTATVQLGYAAVKTFGIQTSGTLTLANVNEAVRRHAALLAQTARNAGLEEGIDLGHKIYTHGFADQGNTTAFPFSNMLTQHATPGWSFYSHAYSPGAAAGFSGTLDALGNGVNAKWGAVEWLYIGGLGGSAFSQWEAAFRNTFGYRNNRMINIHNWEGLFAPRPPAQPQLDALANAGLEFIGCQVGEPLLEDAVVQGSQVTMRWQPGADTSVLFFIVSNSPVMNNAGGLAFPNVAQDVVTGTKTMVKTMSPGTYYWTVVADGCNPGQRAISDVKSFVVK